MKNYHAQGWGNWDVNTGDHHPRARGTKGSAGTARTGGRERGPHMAGAGLLGWGWETHGVANAEET